MKKRKSMTLTAAADADNWWQFVMSRESKPQARKAWNLATAEGKLYHDIHDCIVALNQHCIQRNYISDATKLMTICHAINEPMTICHRKTRWPFVMDHDNLSLLTLWFWHIWHAISPQRAAFWAPTFLNNLGHYPGMLWHESPFFECSWLRQEKNPTSPILGCVTICHENGSWQLVMGADFP